MKETISNQEPRDLVAFEYDQWRTQFINYVLRIISVLGLFLLASIMPQAKPFEKVVFTVAYLAIVAVTFIRLSNRIKAGVLPVVGYGLGTYTLLKYGPWSDSTLLLLASVVFAGLLFNKQLDRFFLALSTVTLLATASFNLFGNYALDPKVPKTDGMDWLIYCVGFIVMGLTITWAIELLKQEFKSVANQYQSSLELLTKDRVELEQRVEDRTAGLTKKSDQLRAASYIARQTAEAQDLTSLLEIVAKLVTVQFGFYHAGIFLINETGDEAVLQAASSEGGKRMIERGHSLTVGTQGIVGYVAAQKRPRIALDVGADAIFFNNPDLPMTRSEVALPLVIRNKVLGVLDIQSDQPQAFKPDDIDVLQTLADQVAVAIENAKLLDESQAALMQLEAVTSLRTHEAWSQKLQNQKHAYTYTPLGVRAENSSKEEVPGIKVPITLRGQKIGTISLSRKDHSDWSKVDQDLINEVAYQAGLAVDNIRLLEEAKERARQEQTVGTLAARFSQSLDIDSLLQTAARELGQVPDVSEVSVFIGELPEQVPQKRRSKRTTG